MRKLLWAACLLLCAAVPAAAQEEPSPGEMAAVRELLEVMRMRENMQRTMELMLGGALGEDMPPGFTEAMREFFAEHFRYDDMHEGFVRVYTELFTEEELRAFTAFYRTPAGQRFVELTPEIARRTQEVTAQIMEEAMPDLMRIMMEAMEEEGMPVEAEKAPPVRRKS